MKVKHILYYILCIVALAACNTDENVDESVQEDEFKDVALGKDLMRIGMPERLDTLIENLSLSDDMIGILADADKNMFDESILNPTENVKTYTTSRNRAVNMGIYGAELNYILHFGQTNFSMKYMLASKQLADQIGVAMAFDQQTVEEYQANIENTDSLINIIFVVYDNAKRMLKNEEQFMLSSLVIVGSWIENMYITTEFISRSHSVQTKSKLITKIWEQRHYLKEVLTCIHDLDEGDNVYVTDLISELTKIDSVYDSFGDKLLQESDVEQLRNQISIARKRLIDKN